MACHFTNDVAGVVGGIIIHDQNVRGRERLSQLRNQRADILGFIQRADSDQDAIDRSW